ncbi:MAG TPA: Crp/Fnr family transcriptional regulator [Bacilli bacterium]
MNDCHACETQPYRACVDKVPFFRNLSVEEKQHIAEAVIHKKFYRGEFLFSQGDILGSLLIVHTGSVKIFRLSATGKEQIIRILGPGDFTGEYALFGANPSTNGAEALQATEVCMIRGADMKRLILRYPNIAIKLLEEYAAISAESESHIEQLSLFNVEQRLASLILRLGKHSCDDKVCEITLPASKSNLASFLGMTRETISRKLSLFQEQGWIELVNGRKIRILDVDSLQKVVNSEPEAV